MLDIQNIVFIKEYIKDYASVVAIMLSNYPKSIFCIKNKSDINKTDIIGYTYFSINSFDLLRKIRLEFSNNKIIVGGIGVYAHYIRILEIADFLYFGEAFEFNNNSVLSKKKLKQTLKIQQSINFEKIPIVRAGKKLYYCEIEKGCPYRCEFCYVSWVNKFSQMSDDNFIKKCNFIDSKLKGNQITFIANEGLVKDRNSNIFNNLNNNKYDNQSLPISTYIKNYNAFKNQSIVRFGIELPTEKSRIDILPKIKKITDEMLIDVIRNKTCKIMQFFYIYNYVGIKECDYGKIFDIVKNKKQSFLLRLSFTNLEIQPYTKITNRISEHIEQTLKYSDFSDSGHIKKLNKISRVKVFPAKGNSQLLYWYFFTYLPIQYKIRKPKSKEKAIDYFNSIKQTNNNVDIIGLCQENAYRMVIDNNIDIKLNL